MNVNGGFNLPSFYYESPDPGSVYIISGLEGAGATLAVVPLTASATWSAAGTEFSGTALSAVFDVADSRGSNTVSLTSLESRL